MLKNTSIHQALRIILPFLIAAASNRLRAQPAEKDNIRFDKQLPLFTQVVEVPEKNQAALYKLATYWAANNAPFTSEITPPSRIKIQNKLAINT